MTEEKDKYAVDVENLCSDLSLKYGSQTFDRVLRELIGDRKTITPAEASKFEKHAYVKARPNFYLSPDFSITTGDSTSSLDIDELKKQGLVADRGYCR